MKNKLFLMLILLLPLWASCKIQAPQVKGVDSAKIDKVSMGEIKLNADLNIYNPNWFSAKILEMEVEIYANDALIGKIDKRNKFRIKSSNDFKIPLTLSIKPASLSLSMIAAFASGGKSDLTFKVKGKARSLLIKKKFSFEHKEKIQF